MERYPRRRQMHKPGMSKIFDFATLEDYRDACKEGWCYNPADVGKALETDKHKEEVENIPQPHIHRPEVPGQINPEPINPLKCKLCDFVGKNEKSLKTHKRMKHGNDSKQSDK